MIMKIFHVERHGFYWVFRLCCANRSLYVRAMSKFDRILNEQRRNTWNWRNSILANVTIFYWRDIPAQVVVGKGRSAAKLPLPERFEQAIDRAAMKSGAAGTDEYLAEWRRGTPYPIEGDDDHESVAQTEAARIDAEYDLERIKALIGNDGWEAA